jgi:hypothetical protein
MSACRTGVVIGFVALGWALVSSSVRAQAVAHQHPTKGLVPKAGFGAIGNASRREILAYASAVSFDTSYHATDSRRLVIKGAGGFSEGPLVSVAPAVGSTSLTLGELASGRIIARVTADARWLQAGYGRGNNFIWVDRIADQWRAFLIPSDTTLSIRTLPLRVSPDEVRAQEPSPDARFRWNDRLGSESLWIRCSDRYCQLEAGSK